MLMQCVKILKRVRNLKQRIEVNKRTVEKLESEKYSLPAISADKITVSGGSADKDRIGRLVSDVESLKVQIFRDTERLIQAYSDVLAICEKIENAQYRIIIQDHYMNGLTFKEIADNLYFTPKWIEELHKRAVKVVEKIVEEMEE